MSECSQRRVRSLYVHIPFCARKCVYCAFYSEPTEGARMERFVAALIRELEMVAGTLHLGTVFFGGGSPSLLSLSQWKRILGAMERLGLLGAWEWTIECNPATVSLEKARLWREHGVNRISLGVQSLNERLLERLGRVHDRAMVFKSFDILRQAGFANVNVDLIYGIPGQTLSDWRATLAEVRALQSEHLSCYEVTYEEDTPLYEQLRAGRYAPDEELVGRLYEELVRQAGESGFEQYEVSNFARSHCGEEGEIPRLACRHNVNYWRGGEYCGVGPSASSYLDGVRTTTLANTDLYCTELERGARARQVIDALEPVRRAGEIAAFGLRLTAGWPFRVFTEVTGFDLRGEWVGEMKQLETWGWARADEDCFRLTPTGLRFADAAGELFLR